MIEKLLMLIDKQFTNYYRLTNKEMSISERLFFEDIRDNVIAGVEYELEKNGDNNE